MGKQRRAPTAHRNGNGSAPAADHDLTAGTTSAEAMTAVAALERWAARGGLDKAECAENVARLERLRLEHAVLRWTLLRGQTPDPGEWNTDDARAAGWPTPDEILAVYGSVAEFLESSNADASPIVARLELLAEAEARLQARETEIEAELKQVRVAQAEAERIAKKRPELERQLGRAKAKADEAREALRQTTAERDALRQRADVAEDALSSTRAELEEIRSQAGRALPARLPAPGLDGEGRCVYALWLAFHGDATFDRAVAIAAEWIERGPHSDTLGRGEPGRRTVEAVQPGAFIEEHLHGDPDGDRRLWQAIWRQPFRRSLYLQAEVTVVRAGDQLLAGLTLRITRPSARLDRVSFAVDPPKLPCLWLRDLASHDGDVRLACEPLVLASHELDGLLALIDSGARRRPVVLAGEGGEQLARACAGLAHVVECPDELREDAQALLGIDPAAFARDHAVLVWPGAKLPVAPESVTLIEGGGRLAERVARHLQAAAVVGLPAPAVVNDLRREAARLRLTEHEQDTEGDDLLALAEEAFNENEALRAQVDGLTQHVDGLERQVADLESAARAHGYAPEPEVAESEALDDDLSDIGPGSHTQAIHHVLTYAAKQKDATVAEAVRRAAGGLCKHLTFTENAFESAADSPYRQPGTVLADLIKLDRVAEMYLRGGVGQSLHAISQELGLDWVEDCNAADHGATERHYRFVHEGRTWTMRQHVRVGGRSSGDGSIARIYVALHAGDNTHERAVLVGHVGRHLPDSTT